MARKVYVVLIVTDLWGGREGAAHAPGKAPIASISAAPARLFSWCLNHAARAVVSAGCQGNFGTVVWCGCFFFVPFHKVSFLFVVILKNSFEEEAAGTHL